MSPDALIFTEHLEELRGRLINAVVVPFLGCGI